MNKNTEAGTDAFTDKPDANHIKSMQGAWQRAADKHGEQYANDIFPTGKPEAGTDAGNVPRVWKKSTFAVAVNPRCGHEVDKMRNGYVYANLFGIDARSWNVTHLPSGYKMPGYFNRLKDAKRYVAEILPLTEWATITEDSTEQLRAIAGAVSKAAKSDKRFCGYL